MRYLPRLVSPKLYWSRAHKRSKVWWIDAYFDLYHQTINDTEQEEVVMKDAELRMEKIRKL